MKLSALISSILASCATAYIGQLCSSGGVSSLFISPSSVFTHFSTRSRQPSGMKMKSRLTHKRQSTGTCEKNSWCDSRQGVHDIHNLCPNDPDDVMCCFYPLCDNNQGSCDITSNGQMCHGTGGHWVTYVVPPKFLLSREILMHQS
jgi:hypothetical protein